MYSHTYIKRQWPDLSRFYPSIAMYVHCSMEIGDTLSPPNILSHFIIVMHSWHRSFSYRNSRDLTFQLVDMHLLCSKSSHYTTLFLFVPRFIIRQRQISSLFIWNIIVCFFDDRLKPPYIFKLLDFVALCYAPLLKLSVFPKQYIYLMQTRSEITYIYCFQKMTRTMSTSYSSKVKAHLISFSNMT